MKKFLVLLTVIFLNICNQSNAVVINELEIKNNNRISKETISTYGKITLGKDPETGVIILDEDPQWVWIREGEGGNYIELRLDKEYGYQLNIKQNDFEIIDFELEGIENAIDIIQAQ